jgi:hypothetical protein
MKILFRALLSPILLVSNKNIYKTEINQNYISKISYEATRGEATALEASLYDAIYFCEDDYDCADHMICVKLFKYGICQIDKKKRKLIPIYIPIPID